MAQLFPRAPATATAPGPATCAPVEHHLLTLDLTTPGAPVNHVYTPGGGNGTINLNFMPDAIWEDFLPLGCGGPNLEFSANNTNILIDF